MLTFIAIAVGAVALWMLFSAVRPLVERGVVTASDWERVENEALNLLDRRDRLVAELRELEFEAALDKIGRKDLDELRTRYELEAVALDRKLDQHMDTYSARIDAAVEARLSRPEGAAPDDAPPAVEAPRGEKKVAEGACPSCGFANRPGARFCNECGSPLTLPAGVAT